MIRADGTIADDNIYKLLAVSEFGKVYGNKALGVVITITGLSAENLRNTQLKYVNKFTQEKYKFNTCDVR